MSAGMTRRHAVQVAVATAGAITATSYIKPNLRSIGIPKAYALISGPGEVQTTPLSSLPGSDTDTDLAPTNGTNGAPGVPGTNGGPGAPGTNGGPGAPGGPGSPGPMGGSGAPGSPGSPGATGGSGAPGSPGATGPAGSPGTPASSGANGAPGSSSTSSGAPGQSGTNGQNGAAGAAGAPAAANTPATGAPGNAPTTSPRLPPTVLSPNAEIAPGQPSALGSGPATTLASPAGSANPVASSAPAGQSRPFALPNLGEAVGIPIASVMALLGMAATGWGIYRRQRRPAPVPVVIPEPTAAPDEL